MSSWYKRSGTQVTHVSRAQEPLDLALQSCSRLVALRMSMRWCLRCAESAMSVSLVRLVMLTLDLCDCCCCVAAVLPASVLGSWQHLMISHGTLPACMTVVHPGRRCVTRHHCVAMLSQGIVHHYGNELHKHQRCKLNKTLLLQNHSRRFARLLNSNCSLLSSLISLHSH